MKYVKRTYTLNDRVIPSNTVGGELHTARGHIGNCAKCFEPITKGQQYVKIFVINGEPLHLECWLIDHDMTIVAVGIRKTMNGKVVICESEVELAKRLNK
jgi:hypothetical protein